MLPEDYPNTSIYSDRRVVNHTITSPTCRDHTSFLSVLNRPVDNIPT
jgi:hypothetical protein